MVRGLRLVKRGLSDTFEHLLPFTLTSLVWWLCVLLVVPAPGALLALFQQADPRHGIESDRPGFREGVRYGWQRIPQGWGLVALTVPVLAVLVYDISYGQTSDNVIRLLGPLWIVLLMLGTVATLSAFSLVAILAKPVLTALRLALLITAARLPAVLVVSVALYLIVAVGALLVVPLIMFLPVTVAATINRLVLDALRIPIVDPLDPTEERLREEAATRSRSRFGP